MKKLIPALMTCTVLAMAASIGPEARPVLLPEGHEFTNPDRQVFSISPDGTRVTYVAKATIYIESLRGGEPIIVPGPLAGRPISSPVFSPDGQSIIYWTTDGALLKRVPASGGTPVTICNAVQPFGMSWGADDQILFGQGAKGIMRVSARGGTPVNIVQAKSGEILHGPHMLPDGESVLFTVGDEHADSKVRWEQSHIVVQNLKTGERKTVVAAGRDARNLPGGYLAYVLGGRVMTVRFDAAKLTTSGQPVPVLDNVQTALVTGTAQFDVSPNGTLVYLSADIAPLQMGLVGLDGTRKMLGQVPEDTTAPRVSGDGLQVTYAAENDIYVADLANLATTRKVITDGTFPLFSVDGKWIAFGSMGTKRSGGAEEIFVQRADGSGKAELVAKPARAPEHWVDNEEFSYISHRGIAENYDIFTYNGKEKGLTPVAVFPQSAELASRFSPDSKWITYMSSESGDWQVYLQPWPGTGVKYQVTKQRGRLPLWSADGRTIYYDWDGKMFAIPVNFGSSVTFGEPSPLPVTGYIQPLIRRNYDMTGDLKQFVMLFRAAPRFEVISNLFDDLKKRLPTN